jgi:hypothetical protein
MYRPISRSTPATILVLALTAIGAVLLMADSASAQLPQIPGITPGEGTTPPATGEEGGGVPGTTPPSGTRQTTITNQFTSATSGSIQQRAPGLWIEQAIAVHGGDTSFFTGVPEEPPNFFRDTFNQVFTQIATVIQDLLNGLSMLITAGQGSGGGGSGTQNPAWVPIPNAATSGQGQSVTIQ